MAYDPIHPAPMPLVRSLVDAYTPTSTPRLRWPEHPGAVWTPEAALGQTITKLVVHYEGGANIPAGRPLSYYYRQLAEIAVYHAFTRDWSPDEPGVQQGFGFMYHWVIAPTEPRATLIQTQPETLRTWNARADNRCDIAIVLLAGEHDSLHPPSATLLRAYLDWMVRGRADLPAIIAAHVITHDESLARQGQAVKGCPGPYATTVAEWRTARLMGRL